jgi:hypothetical protein
VKFITLRSYHCGRSQATLVSFRYCGQFRLGGKIEQ